MRRYTSSLTFLTDTSKLQNTKHAIEVAATGLVMQPREKMDTWPFEVTA